MYYSYKSRFTQIQKDEKNSFKKKQQRYLSAHCHHSIVVYRDFCCFHFVCFFLFHNYLFSLVDFVSGLLVSYFYQSKSYSK